MEEAGVLPSEVDGVVAMEEHHGNGVSPASEETGVGLDVEPDDASEAARREERVVVKFLVPNVAAGSIIGKGGANITEVQTQSNARMQLSRASEFYPGSPEGQDRILLVSGTVNQLLTALHLVLSKLKAEPGALRAVQAKDGEAIQLRMLVHSRLCGTLIGKGGATIRSFNEDSHAVFNISPPPTMPGLTERIVKITGDVDELMRAVALVITKLSENPDYHLLTDANLSYSMRYAPMSPAGPGAHQQPPPPPQQQQQPYGGPLHLMGAPGGGLMGGPGSGLGGPAPHMLHMGPMSPGPRANGGAPTGGATITIAVPEDKVGVVIGKQGAVINQIKELLGVSIRISKKGEFLPGTYDRACSITGTPEAVEIAQRLVQQKIEAIHL
ncbi:hypothetical protein ABPG77_006845 [Micractinium sp. CCAP 211/92]